MDIYGGIEYLKGERGFIPFRYQGQYEDEETGLYYNRFRYYSPDSGTYISQDPIGLAGNNPDIYAYVSDVNTWVDVFGLAPTNPIDRAFLKDFLGNEAKKGGVYMFKTIDLRDDVEKWYIGKTNNLYRRLRTHLGTGKLNPAKLSTLNVVIIPNGVEADFLNAEADMIKRFKDAGENLANRINSPGCC